MSAASSFEFIAEDGHPAVRGDIDARNADDLYRALCRHDGRGAIDLSGVTSFDTDALQALLRAVDDDPRVRIVNPSAAVTRVLRETHTYDHVVDDLT